MIVKAKRLTKRFYEQKMEITALDDIDLDIKNGATALLGPNGSGKSTLIKLILGLLTPTSGKIELFPGINESIGKKLMRVGYMPETPSLISGVNAVKFIRHIGMISGLSYNLALQRAHEVLDYVGIFEERYREIKGYSTGMKQRILFAQALVHDPEFLILDEPTTGLSPEGRSEMLQLISEISKEYGKSILFSTHILPDVEKICHNVIILHLGKVLYEGSSSQIIKDAKKGKRIVVSTNVEKVTRDFIEHGMKVIKDWRQENAFFVRTHEKLSFSFAHEIAEQNGATLIEFRDEEVSLENLFVDRIKEEVKA